MHVSSTSPEKQLMPLIPHLSAFELKKCYKGPYETLFLKKKSLAALLFANRKLLIVESALIYFMRSRVAILIAAAIIASVLAAGCTSSTQNQSTSQSASSTTHDPVLQAVINDDLQAYNNASWVRTLNQSIQWVNATTAMVTYRVTNPNESLAYTAQYVKFASAV